MHTQQLNRFSSKALALLSVCALITVVIGYTQPSLPDEGALAHIFQLTMVAVGVMLVLFLSTADWTAWKQTAQRLTVPAAALILAFSALYYLEHVWYLRR